MAGAGKGQSVVARTRYRVATIAPLLWVALLAVGGQPAEDVGSGIAGVRSNTYGSNDDGSYPCARPEVGVPPGCTSSLASSTFNVNSYGTTYSNPYLNNNRNFMSRTVTFRV